MNIHMCAYFNPFFLPVPLIQQPTPPITIHLTQGLETAGEESVEVHRYPFAGGRNARVTLWAVRFDEGGLSLAERWAMACRGQEPPR